MFICPHALIHPPFSMSSLVEATGAVGIAMRAAQLLIQGPCAQWGKWYVYITCVCVYQWGRKIPVRALVLGLHIDKRRQNIYMQSTPVWKLYCNHGRNGLQARLMYILSCSNETNSIVQTWTSLSHMWFQMILASRATCNTIYTGSIMEYTLSSFCAILQVCKWGCTLIRRHHSQRLILPLNVWAFKQMFRP